MRSLNIYIHDLGELCAVSPVSEASLAFFGFLAARKIKIKHQSQALSSQRKILEPLGVGEALRGHLLPPPPPPLSHVPKHQAQNHPQRPHLTELTQQARPPLRPPPEAAPAPAAG